MVARMLGSAPMGDAIARLGGRAMVIAPGGRCAGQSPRVEAPAGWATHGATALVRAAAVAAVAAARRQSASSTTAG